MNKKFILNSIIVLALSLVVFFVYHCKNPKIESDYYSPDVLATHFNGEQYVGSETCLECHADIYATHIETAHYNTSALVKAETIKGNFEIGSNTLDLKDVAFEMVSEGESFYQHITIKNRTIQKPPVKFDIVLGSSVMGQTYLTWEQDKLFQLQASYYASTDSWVNSPGYPSYNLERPVGSACLKCHVTFAKNHDSSGFGNEFYKENMIYGVDCEKCHRPSAKHVIYHRKNPEADESKFMLKIDTLSRQQRLDVCAQCHSGLRMRQLKGNPFSFLPGENLNEYSLNAQTASKNSTLDVHGNQYGLLTSSKCFKQTSKMDCTTCHDTHKKQRGDTTYFNQKCMGCHTDPNSTICKAELSEINKMANNCIACHMPIFPSKVISVQLENDSLKTPFYIRTHLIGIYPKEL